MECFCIQLPTKYSSKSNTKESDKLYSKHHQIKSLLQEDVIQRGILKQTRCRNIINIVIFSTITDYNKNYKQHLLTTPNVKLRSQ